MENHTKNRTWVDIGCESDEILLGANKRSMEAVGIDSNASSVQFALEPYGIEIKDSIAKLESSLENTGVVSVFNVIEHGSI